MFMQEHGIQHPPFFSRRTALTHDNIFEYTKVPISKLLYSIHCFGFQVDSLKLLCHKTRHNFDPRTRAYYIEVLLV